MQYTRPGADGPIRRRIRADFDPEEYAPRRKINGQRPVDFYSPAIQHVLRRMIPSRTPYGYHVPPHEYYTKDLLAACHTAFNASTALCTQWVNTSFHPDARLSRTRVPIYSIAWAPNARRLLCTTARGEFLLFNGHSFGLEVKTVAHEDNKPCRATSWGAQHQLILSGDDAGKVKMWMSNLVLIAEYDSGHRAVREFTWAPLEAKFCTAGQDGSARVWDLNRVGSSSHTTTTTAATTTTNTTTTAANTTTNTNASHASSNKGNSGGAAAAFPTSSGPQLMREEVKLEGHGGDVTTVDWHPFRSLVATGSQDTQCRLWDPRTAARGSIAALQGHSQALTCVRWHGDGRTLLTASRDGAVKLWDIRQTQPELIRFKGHIDSVERVAWHPSVPDLFVSAGLDGSIKYWMVNECEGTPVHNVLEAIKDAATIEAAHDKFRDRANPVFSVAWSPLGNVLASCGTEVKYWARNKPGALEEKERGVEEDVLDDGVDGML